MKVETRRIEQLKNHPLNAEVFGELMPDSCDNDSEFLQSVKDYGVQEPLSIWTDDTVISGHRRRQAAARAGLKEVPVIVRKDIKGKVGLHRAWFEANRHREKTTEQKLRWYAARKEIEEAEAEARQKQKLKKGAESPVGEKFPAREKGRSRDIAAAEVGMSGKTAEKGVEVVKQIDAAVEAGDMERADELRDSLNNESVSAAHRKATGKTEKPKFDDKKVEQAIGSLMRRVDERKNLCGGVSQHKAALDLLRLLSKVCVSWASGKKIPDPITMSLKALSDSAKPWNPKTGE